MKFSIGLDIGQVRDHAAIALVEDRGPARRLPSAPAVPGRSWISREEKPEQRYGVRWVERAPLGTSHADVVARVKQLAKHPELQGRCAVAVDATGVGAPVVDMLRAAELGCAVTAVTITSGEREQQSATPGRMAFSGIARWNVPKRDLLSGVQVLLEQKQLGIAKGMPEVQSLIRELMETRLKVRGGGRVAMGAEGAGRHDDLVMAVALALWMAKRRAAPAGDQAAGRIVG